MNRMHELLSACETLQLGLARMQDQQLNLEDPHYSPLHESNPHVFFDTRPEDVAHAVTNDRLESLAYNMRVAMKALKTLRMAKGVLDLEYEFDSRPASKVSGVEDSINTSKEALISIKDRFATSFTALNDLSFVSPDGLIVLSSQFDTAVKELLTVVRNQSPLAKDKIKDPELIHMIFNARANYATHVIEDLMVDFSRIQDLQDKSQAILKAMDEGIFPKDLKNITLIEYLSGAKMMVEDVTGRVEGVSKFITKLAEMGNGVFLPKEFVATRYVPLPLSP